MVRNVRVNGKKYWGEYETVACEFVKLCNWKAVDARASCIVHDFTTFSERPQYQNFLQCLGTPLWYVRSSPGHLHDKTGEISFRPSVVVP